VVDAAVYAPLTPASGLRPRLVGDRSRTLRAVGTTTDPAAIGIRPAAIITRCGSLLGPDTFARSGNARGRLRYSLGPLQPKSSRRIPYLLSRQEPRRANLHGPQLSPRSADANSPRMVSPTTLEEPLSRDTDL